MLLVLSVHAHVAFTVPEGSLEEDPAHASKANNGYWNAGSSSRDPAETEKIISLELAAGFVRKKL